MFIEIPASPHSYARRRLVMGMGVNDAPYLVRYKDHSGKTLTCPYYATWANMLERCTQKFQDRRPSYQGCTVVDEWKRFSVFRSWMKSQPWKGRALDKDLLGQGGKHYSPQTCVFIPKALNNLLTLRQRARGDLPLGVSQTTINGSTYFVASCSFYGRQKRLGYFKSVEEAAKAYRKAKLGHIKDLANKEPDPRVKQALLNIY